MGKFKKGIIIAIVCMVCVAIVACTNNNNEEEDIGTEENTETVDSTSNDYSDDSNEDTEDETETDDIDDEDYDYSEDEVDEPLTTSDTLESKLEEIADEVAMDVDANDYKVTYQYEPENNTGYIFITWLGANDASKSDVKTMLEVSGFKDVMQEIANYTAEELKKISAKGKEIRGCVVLRDMSNKQLDSCYDE
jgi:hypothetical protein